MAGVRGEGRSEGEGGGGTDLGAWVAEVSAGVVVLPTKTKVNRPSLCPPPS